MELHVRQAVRSDYEDIDKITYLGFTKILEELNDEHVFTRASSYLCAVKGSAVMRSDDAVSFVCIESSTKSKGGGVFGGVFDRVPTPPRRASLTVLRKKHQEEFAARGGGPPLPGVESEGDGDGTKTTNNGSPLCMIAADASMAEMEEYKRVKTLRDPQDADAYHSVKLGIRTRVMRQQGKFGLENPSLSGSVHTVITGTGSEQEVGAGRLDQMRRQSVPYIRRASVSPSTPVTNSLSIPPSPLTMMMMPLEEDGEVNTTDEGLTRPREDSQDSSTRYGGSVASPATTGASPVFWWGDSDSQSRYSSSPGFDPSRGVSAYRKSSEVSQMTTKYAPATKEEELDKESSPTKTPKTESFISKFLTKRKSREGVKKERLVGCVTYAPYESGWAVVADPGEVELRMLCVAANPQAAGLLIEHCIKVADREERCAIHALVSDQNKPAHLLYWRHGFTRNPPLDRYEPKTGQFLKCFTIGFRHLPPPPLPDCCPLEPEAAPGELKAVKGEEGRNRNTERMRVLQQLERMEMHRLKIVQKLEVDLRMRANLVQQIDDKSTCVVCDPKIKKEFYNI